MSDNDLIRRGDARMAVTQWWTFGDPEDLGEPHNAIAALPAVTVGVPEAMRQMIVQAVRFANLAAGEGICIADLEPETFLFNYSHATGDEDWDTLPARILAALEPVATPAVTVGADAVLDAAHQYLLEQYGASPLAHPTDRASILALISKGAADEPR